jgi:hypothetical protein
MRKLLPLLVFVASFGPLAASSAAGPDLPGIPPDCHDVNELLHIENVRDCENN